MTRLNIKLYQQLDRLGLIDVMTVKLDENLAIITYNNENYSICFIEDVLTEIEEMKTGDEFIEFLKSESIPGDIRDFNGIIG